MSEAEPRKPRRRRRRRGGNPRQPKAATAPLETPRLRREQGTETPLSPAEVRVMREHLRLLQRYKKLLGLSLNAKEDLLINGAAAPEHRGVCLHLLGKVDRASVQRALDRLPNAADRSRLLAGVVRFSEDQGILLQWLESLPDSASRTAAAGALSMALDRLDWDGMSAARMERLLEVLATVFTEPHERADVVFGLLHSPSFRSTFEQAEDRLPKPLATVFGPLRAAYDAVVAGTPGNHSHGLVRKGTAMLLSAPEAALLAKPAGVRERLLRAALAAPPADEDADRAAGALLESFSSSKALYRTLSLERIGELLRRHADSRAQWQLKRLRTAQPDCVEAKELTLALAAPRLGRVVLGCPEDWRPRPPGAKKHARSGHGLQRGFWLDRRLPVLVRTGDSDRLSAEAERHAALPVAGLAPLITRGRGWLAFAAVGRPLDDLLSRGPAPGRKALLIAADGLRVLGTLALAGLHLPDARPRRFLITGGESPRVLLHDLGGASKAPEGRSAPAPGQAAGWVRDVLRGADVPPGLQRVLSRRKGGAAALLAEIEASF